MNLRNNHFTNCFFAKFSFYLKSKKNSGYYLQSVYMRVSTERRLDYGEGRREGGLYSNHIDAWKEIETERWRSEIPRNPYIFSQRLADFLKIRVNTPVCSRGDERFRIVEIHRNWMNDREG